MNTKGAKQGNRGRNSAAKAEYRGWLESTRERVKRGECSGIVHSSALNQHTLWIACVSQFRLLSHLSDRRERIAEQETIVRISKQEKQKPIEQESHTRKINRRGSNSFYVRSNPVLHFSAYFFRYFTHGTERRLCKCP